MKSGMKAIFMFIFVSVLVIPTVANSFNIYRVGAYIKGQSHNENLQSWTDRKLSLWVGITGKKNGFLFIKVETALGDATARIIYAASLNDKLMSLIKTAINWSHTALIKRTDKKKPIGCAGDSQFGICERTGVAVGKDQAGFSFVSADKGRQTKLIVTVIDRNNRYKTATIYIDLPGMKKLLDNIKMIDETFKDARETASKQDSFK